MSTQHLGHLAATTASSTTSPSGLTTLATGVAAFGAAVNAGVFLAFSTFVMAGLRRAPAASGLASMQGINRAATASPLFMVTLFGTAGVCLVLVAVGAVRHGRPGALLQVAGGAAFLVAIVLTAAYHVPHNDALAALDPHAAGSSQAWSRYLEGWTRWNHVRTAACALSAVLLGLATRAT